MYRQNKNTAEWIKQIYIIGRFYDRLSAELFNAGLT